MGNTSAPTNQNIPVLNPTKHKEQGHPTALIELRQAIMKYYQLHDPSKGGVDGISVDVCLAMSELAGNKLIAVLIYDFVNEKTGCLHQEEFINFYAFLSPHTNPTEKKKALFDSFDVYDMGVLTHDEIFRLYKVMLGHVISDDHILALTFKALDHPKLKKQGEITKEEFMRMIPDSEVDDRLTVYFKSPSESII